MCTHILFMVLGSPSEMLRAFFGAGIELGAATWLHAEPLYYIPSPCLIRVRIDCPMAFGGLIGDDLILWFMTFLFMPFKMQFYLGEIMRRREIMERYVQERLWLLQRGQLGVTLKVKERSHTSQGSPIKWKRGVTLLRLSCVAIPRTGKALIDFQCLYLLFSMYWVTIR